MSEGGSRARVGVRELRQNLSVYLRRVESGETLDVTEHGRLVARLAPAPAPETSTLDRLIAEGALRLPPSGWLAPRADRTRTWCARSFGGASPYARGGAPVSVVYVDSSAS